MIVAMEKTRMLTGYLSWCLFERVTFWWWSCGGPNNCGGEEVWVLEHRGRYSLPGSPTGNEFVMTTTMTFAAGSSAIHVYRDQPDDLQCPWDTYTTLVRLPALPDPLPPVSSPNSDDSSSILLCM